MNVEGKEGYNVKYPPLLKCVRYGTVYLCRGTITAGQTAATSGTCGPCKSTGKKCQQLSSLHGPAHANVNSHPWERHTSLLRKLLYAGQLSKGEMLKIGDEIFEIERSELCPAAHGHDTDHVCVSHPAFFDATEPVEEELEDPEED
jgi:hypothetical protein